MSYVSLYRKYRPQTFDDVVGQTHVLRTLRNAIEEDRLSHAYLFTGPRGTGKTSTARILAKAINCVEGPTPSPCGTCAQCVAITDGTSVDVIELDMASHGGVDDARELRERALFSPASARRKVYILDEVHMASTAAFNALLKLIEEPPSHVLFAMATTDPQKVLPTIMSRVQRLDLRRVDATSLAAHIRDLCGREGYEIDDGALDAVVRAGDGSVRDTLSVLEQVLAFAGREVTAEAVAQTLGHTPVERVLETVDLLAARDLAGLLSIVQSLLDEGHDLRRFTLDLVQHVRDLLVLQVAPDRPDLVDATDERRGRLQEQSGSLGRATLLRIVEHLAVTVTEQRQGSPRLPLELALAQLATPGADGDLSELADRVARLEATGGSRPAATVAAAPTPVATARTAPSDPDPPSPSDPDTQAPSDPDTPAPAGGAATPQEPAQTPPVVPDEPSVPSAAPGADAPATAEPVAPETSVAPVASAVPAAPAGADAPAAAEPVAPGADAPAAAEPVTPGADAPATAPARPEDASDLDVVLAAWEGILEVIKEGSRRHHAMLEPATPIDVTRGILTLRYGRRHASFHAVQARRGEINGALQAAIDKLCGMRVRIDVKVEGEDARRRPMPPSVTPEDARTPVLDNGPVRDDPSPAAAAARRASTLAAVPDPDAAAEAIEADEVHEAELESDAPSAEAVDIDALLEAELDAQLIEEHPPSAGS